MERKYNSRVLQALLVLAMCSIFISVIRINEKKTFLRRNHAGLEIGSQYGGH